MADNELDAYTYLELYKDNIYGIRPSIYKSNELFKLANLKVYKGVQTEPLDKGKGSQKNVWDKSKGKNKETALGNGKGPANDKKQKGLYLPSYGGDIGKEQEEAWDQETGKAKPSPSPWALPPRPRIEKPHLSPWTQRGPEAPR